MDATELYNKREQLRSSSLPARRTLTSASYKRRTARAVLFSLARFPPTATAPHPTFHSLRYIAQKWLIKGGVAQALRPLLLLNARRLVII